MSRPLRLEYPGAWWHVTNRGVEQRSIFLSDTDRRTFIEILAGVVGRFGWLLHAYVLMTNHYHLLVETPEPTLSRGMKKLGQDHAELFNFRHSRVGHLFQGRFKGHLIDSESYLLNVARYIVLNPVRAKLVENALSWRWSSARVTAGKSGKPSWLTTASILHRFDPLDEDRARREYVAFVADPQALNTTPWADLRGGVYLGGPQFLERVQQRIDERARSREHPVAQRAVRRPTLGEIAAAIAEATGRTVDDKRARESRQLFVYLATVDAAAPLVEVGRVLGIGATGASYLSARASARMECDDTFGARLRDLRSALKNCRLKM